MSDHWSREEVEAAVSDYFDMLAIELVGGSVNKAEHNRLLRQFVTRRTRGSIERKHQNISAVLIELGYPYITGYKPLRNYQEVLGAVVQERLAAVAKTGLDEIIGSVVNANVPPPTRIENLLGIEVPPPVRDKESDSFRERGTWTPPRERRNYLETEARNQSLGLAGEKLILEFEHERLWRAGERALADRVDHCSQTTGDHLGFDIHSFETNGRDRLIEVKTTRFGASTPFFVTVNEVSVSQNNSEEYHLYRVFGYEKDPRLFMLRGALDRSCILTPNQFTANVW
jgi:Domain of unknown function (DUF3883)